MYTIAQMLRTMFQFDECFNLEYVKKTLEKTAEFLLTTLEASVGLHWQVRKKCQLHADWMRKLRKKVLHHAIGHARVSLLSIFLPACPLYLFLPYPHLHTH